LGVRSHSCAGRIARTGLKNPPGGCVGRKRGKKNQRTWVAPTCKSSFAETIVGQVAGRKGNEIAKAGGRSRRKGERGRDTVQGKNNDGEGAPSKRRNQGQLRKRKVKAQGDFRQEQRSRKLDGRGEKECKGKKRMMNQGGTRNRRRHYSPTRGQPRYQKETGKDYLTLERRGRR